MPMYCYRNQATNEVLEEVYPMGKAPRRIRRDGKHYVRDIASEFPMVTPPGIGGHRMRRSRALGVPPFQIPAMQKHLKETAGYDAKFDPKTGEMLFSSRADRNRAMEATGTFDQDAGYGDRAPTNC
ncbi:MAG TPA: hypothetical protein PLS23_07295 [Phycisphaerae bacterium]|nr:hypothetical protein [Phycisphaerae bacterium]